LGEPSNRHEVVVGEEAQVKSLIEKFPNEERAIKKYFKYMRKARKCLTKAFLFKSIPLPIARVLTRTGLHRLFDGGYTKWSSKTVQEVVEALTDDKDLQAIFEYNWGDYGTEPSTASFFFHSLSQTHFYEGAFYPNGGPTNISKKVIKEINNNGGKVLVSAPVKRILVDEKTKKVTGVEMVDGNVINSSVVVSNAGIMNTITKLLPPGLVNIDFAKEDSYTASKLRTGATGVNLFVGLKGDHKSLNLPNCQYWIYPSNDVVGTTKKLNDISLDEALTMDPRELSPVFISIPGAKDKAWATDNPDKSAMEIITIGPWHWWDKFESTFDLKTKSHGPEYEAAKRRFSEKLWARVRPLRLLL
jgi:all-trans-retinol 13,14-reductase